jgi:hypothetical protein
MKPDRILQLLSVTARGVGGDYGTVVARLFDAVGELVATRGVEDAIAQVRDLLANPPRKADLTRMEEALRRREAGEPDES